jgi:hypothetical protein
MTIPKSWLIGIAVAVLLLAALGGYEALQAHDALLKADGVQAVQEQKAKADQAVKDQAKEDQVKIDAALQSALSSIDKQRTIIVTPQQAAAVANTLPNLPQQVTVQQVPAVPATATTPAQEATSQIVIPAADIPAFQKYKLDCDESNAKLTACTLNAAKSEIIQTATDDQLKAMTVERDTWRTAAKGGTWLKRTWNVVKFAAPIAGGAYLAGRLSK